MDMIYSIPIVAVLALIFALFTARGIGKKKVDNKKMREIAEAIHEGAMAFLFREYRILAISAKKSTKYESQVERPIDWIG